MPPARFAFLREVYVTFSKQTAVVPSWHMVANTLRAALLRYRGAQPEGETMFEDPPAWTVPVANLTAWFDWTAIGALFAIAAFIGTIIIASAQGGDIRRKDAVFLMAVHDLLEEIARQAENGEAWILATRSSRDDGLEIGVVTTRETEADFTKDLADIVLRSWTDRQYAAQLQAIRLSEFPSVPTAKMFSIARVVADTIRLKLSNATLDGDFAGVSLEVAQIRDQMSQLEREAKARHKFHYDFRGLK